MASDMSRQVGRRIRQRRVEMHLNQRQLAERIAADAVDAQRVSDWERGVNQPSPRYMEMLSTALGREVAWFYEKDTETPDLLGTSPAGETAQSDRIVELLEANNELLTAIAVDRGIIELSGAADARRAVQGWLERRRQAS